MNHSPLCRDVLDIFQRNIGANLEADWETPLKSLPFVDSFVILNILVDLEDHFGFTFEDDADLDQVFASIQSVCLYISERM